MGDFVRPEPIRLSLSGGHYIDIKKRLNHGETEDMYARWAPFVVPGQPANLNRREVRTAKVLTYLLGWSLVMTTGRRRLLASAAGSGTSRCDSQPRS
jgi:hypothetical protein